MTNAILVHATAIEDSAILLRGPPSAGKSDLALRSIDGGARPVADDQAELRRAGKQTERLPENRFEEAPGPIARAAFEASAAAKLRLARCAFPAPLSPAILR